MSRSPLSGDRQADVVVLGAGIAGCAAALELAPLHRVIVLDSGAVGSGGSSEELGHIRTGLDLAYGEAIERFGRDAAREIWDTAREGHARLRERLALFADDCAYRGAGGFRLAEDREEGLSLAASEDLLREDGFSGEFFDHHMLEARFDVRGFAAGYWAADDGEIDAVRLTRALAASAESAGAVIHEASPVLDLDVSPRGAEAVTALGRVRAPVAVVALGGHAPGLVPFFEGRIESLRGRRALFAVEPGALVPSPCVARGGRVAWRVAGDGLHVHAYEARPEDDGGAPDPGSLVAERLPPARGSARGREAGVVGVSVDGFPFVGPIPGLPVVAACGFCRGRVADALLAARWAAQAVAGRDTVPARWRAARPIAGPSW